MSILKYPAGLEGYIKVRVTLDFNTLYSRRKSSDEIGSPMQQVGLLNLVYGDNFITISFISMVEKNALVIKASE